METLAMIAVIIQLAAIIFLCGLFCVKASRAMAEEAERERLRRQTRNAMLTDRHLARLKRNNMRARVEVRG